MGGGIKYRKSFAICEDEANELATSIYQTEGCGVCEKSGAEVFWFNPSSRCAHLACYKKIEPIEASLIAVINDRFHTNGGRNDAHIAAIEAVKRQLDGVSIETFLDTHGAAKLKSIFESAGISAAQTFHSRL